MNRILETFGLKKHLNLTIKMDKSEFIKFLETKVKPNRIFFFDIFDNEQKEFYGNVNNEKFWLRKSDRFFPKSPFASAEGIIKSSSNKTELDIKLIGWNWFILFWFLFMTLIFGLGFNDAIRSNSYGILIVFGPILLMFYLFVILKIRKGVKKLEHYLKSELNENKNVLQQRV
ncbi:hypothetical protein [Winogradskyella forsetii]|uniref:hypothetical protein n=1 Tax=Winogradskyella forsetii TaxID=2686077 RepID=UPI0015B8C5E3|nr:hypothetical protein [Winogradskyella forsetii]